MDFKTLFSYSSLGNPFFAEADFPLEWHMTRNEKYCFIKLLEMAKPKVAIEIGSLKGGSLQVLSRYCQQVYSIDIDPGVEERLKGKFDNVEFITAHSHQAIPKLLARIAPEDLGFVLIDGDHSYDGVRADINLFLGLVPPRPLFIVFHDSFNPECRRGIKAANYHQSSHVHYVEIDFISGVFNPHSLSRQMWGGLALVVMLPEKRTDNLTIHEGQKKLFDALYFQSAHFLPDIYRRGRRLLKSWLGLSRA
jgi:hypothetical protein